MDLGLSEDQQLLRDVARDFLERECTEAHVRDMEDDERGYSPALWRQMADLGWTGLIIPERYGGAGMTYMDLVLLTEEFGRALVPSPYVSTCVAALALLEAGNDQQNGVYLPSIATGEQIWTLAFTEPSARFDAEGIQLEAKRSGEGFVLNGTKLFIRHSHIADKMVVAARSGGDGEDGISLLVVDTNAKGVRHTPFQTVAFDRLNEIRFDDVQVPAEDLLGTEGGAWPALQRVTGKATLLECAYLVGLSQMALDITVGYAKERTQFGQPIASFQALQHRAADMLTDVDSSRYITYKAAWAVSEDEPKADEQVHIAKAWVSEASRRVVANAQQMHGGIGFTKDYRIQLYYRRQAAAAMAYGDADFHRNLVGQSLGI